MLYDWSIGFTHQYFGTSLDYAGGAVSVGPSTVDSAHRNLGMYLGL